MRDRAATMTAVGTGVALALASSLATAVSHALLKAGRDRLAVRAAVSLTCAGLAIPGVIVAPPPDAALAGWLLAATAVHTVYTLVLMVSYNASDFSVAFPLARGTAPVASAVLGAALLGDRLTATTAAGIAVVTLGILGLAAGARVSRTGLAAALCAGALTTAYTIVDARGMRSAPDALTFLAWFFLLDAVAIVPIFAFARRGNAIALLRREGRQGALAGAVATFSYGSALLALRLAPVGVVSALRETSVAFAMVIAAAVLREPVGTRRICCALAVLSGALLVLGAQV